MLTQRKVQSFDATVNHRRSAPSSSSRVKREREREEDPEVPPYKERKEDDSMVTESFFPLYQRSIWTSRRSQATCISYIIWLPSGLGLGEKRGKYALRIIDDGKYLELTVLWPLDTVNPQKIEFKMRSLNAFREEAELIGFESAQLRVKDPTNQFIRSRGVIELPFQVNSHDLFRQNLGWDESGAIQVLVRLTAQRLDSIVDFDNGDFFIGTNILPATNRLTSTDSTPRPSSGDIDDDVEQNNSNRDAPGAPSNRGAPSPPQQV